MESIITITNNLTDTISYKVQPFYILIYFIVYIDFVMTMYILVLTIFRAYMTFKSIFHKALTLI